MSEADIITFPGVRIERTKREVTIKLSDEDWARLEFLAAPLGISRADMAGRILRRVLITRNPPNGGGDAA